MSNRVSLLYHLTCLREADLRFNEALRQADQRALTIKEIGDAKALDLAREIQTYKDEKANELRQQIGDERGRYVTQDQFAPVRDFMTAQTSRGKGVASVWTAAAVAAALAIPFGFGLASYMQSSHAVEPASSTPRVVIPLPPAEPVR